MEKIINFKYLACKSFLTDGYFVLSDEMVEWNSSAKEPSKEDIETKAKELEVEYIIKQQKEAFNKAIQTHLDSKAKEFRYDNMMSARSYAGYDNPFQVEAQKLAVWASNCWVKAGEIEVDVASGTREMPTIDEVLAELPTYE